MSAAVRASVYLCCDAKEANGERCPRTCGWQPDTAEGLEAVIVAARKSGWTVKAGSRGLKGVNVESVCPDHADEVDPPRRGRERE